MNTETISVSSGTSSSRSTNEISCSANASSNSALASSSSSTKHIFLLCTAVSLINNHDSGMSHTSQTGFFISFEGSEGAARAPRFSCSPNTFMGIKPVLVREPGGTAVGESIRHLLQHSAEGRHDCRVAPPFAASRAQLVRENSSSPRRGCDRHLGPFSRLNERLSGCRENDPRQNRRGDQSLAAGPRLPTLPSFSTWMPSRPIRGSAVGGPAILIGWKNSLRNFTKLCAVATWIWRRIVQTGFAF